MTSQPTPTPYNLYEMMLRVHGMRLHDPFLWASIQTRVVVALGIVFLMTVKPGLEEALLTIGVAIILGLVSAWPMWCRRQIKEPAT